MPTVKEVIKKRLKGVRGHVAVAIWCEEDVIGLAKNMDINLSHKAAGEILDTIDQHQNCEMGIGWGTLTAYICEWKRDHPHYRRTSEGELGY